MRQLLWTAGLLAAMSLSACTVREYGYRTYGTNYATTPVNSPPYSNNGYVAPPPGHGTGAFPPGGQGNGYVAPPGSGYHGSTPPPPPGMGTASNNGYVAPPGSGGAPPPGGSGYGNA